MKRGVSKSHKSKVFNSLNIILIAFVLIEIAFVVNEGVLTGQPVRSVSLDGENAQVKNPNNEELGANAQAQETTSQNANVEEPKFNGYIVQLQDEPVSKIYLEEKNKVDKGLSTKQALKDKTNSYRKNLVDKQSILEGKIKNLYPKVKIESRVQNVFNGFAVFDISEEEARRIDFLPEVKAVSPNYEVYLNLMDSVPLIEADEAWNLKVNGTNLTGKGIKIGIIDTGVDYTHSDLGGCFGQGCKVVGGYDFSDNDPDPMDFYGHGTHVAATAAGNGVLKGIAPDAEIYSLKVFPSAGTNVNVIINAINYSVDLNGDGDFSDHLDIISMSLGGPGDPDDPMSKSVDNAVDLGVVAVIAGGNSGPFLQTIGSPGTARKAITVGATFKKDYQNFYLDDLSCEKGYSGYAYCSCVNSSTSLCNYFGNDDPLVDQITPFSSRGPVLTDLWEIVAKPDIAAPGAFICAARYDSIFPEGENQYYYPCLDDRHVQMAGTSMSTPIVSGAVALIKQAHPELNSEEIKSMLKQGPRGVTSDLYSGGFGRVDILNSLDQDFLILPSEVSLGVLKLGQYKNASFRIKNLNGESMNLVLQSAPSNEVSLNLSTYNITLLPFETKEVRINATEINDLPPYYEPLFGYISVVSNMNNDKKYFYYSFVKSTEKLLEGFSYDLGKLIYEEPYSGRIDSITSSDFNKDGLLDFIVEENAVDPFGGGIKINFFENKGNNNFSSPETIYSVPNVFVPSWGYYAYNDPLQKISSADFNNDGYSDILLAGVQGKVRILYNNITRADNQPTIKSLKVGENFSFGGTMFEISYVDPYSVVFTAHTGFDTGYSTGVNYGYPIFIGDIEVAHMGYSYNDQSVNLSFKKSKFDQVYLTDLGQSATTTVADFNGDNKTDFIISFSDDNLINMKLKLFINNGDGSFSDSDIFSYYDERIKSLDSGDYDNDGDLDLIISYNEAVSNIYVYSYLERINNVGDTTHPNFFRDINNKIIISKRGTGVPLDPEGRINPSITSADYDNDGTIDLKVSDNSGKVEFYSNDGNSNFNSEGVLFDFGNIAWGLDSGDYDNDRDIDFLVSSEGNYAFEKLKLFLKENNLKKFSCADLNSDGVRDIIDVSLLINHAFRNGPEPNPKWIGDLNGDGFIDIFDVVHMVNHAFRNGPEPTCTSAQTTTSSSATASLGSATGTTTKTVPVNLVNSESVAGTTFKISYDSLKLYVKNIRTASRTSNMQVIRNGNYFTLVDQNGVNNIPKGSGAVAYIDVTTGKAGFDTSSLKITEVKASNPAAKKIAVSIGKSSVKSANLT